MLNNPYGSNDGEILKRVIRKIYNERVRDWFKDLDSISALDLNIPRHAAYAACRHLESDSLLQAVARQLLFSELRSRLTSGDVGETTKSAAVLRRSHPQVFLFFQEDLSEVEPGYRAVEGKVSFRLMGEDSRVTKTQLTAYAQRIKTAFNTEAEQRWRKGKVMVSYCDWERGYQLQLLCRDKPEGKDLVSRILSIQNDQPDWENFTTSENEQPSTAFPTIPPTDTILGEVRRLPRRRPIATVRFQWAIARIGSTGIVQPLVDRTGRFSNCLVDW